MGSFTFFVVCMLLAYLLINSHFVRLVLGLPLKIIFSPLLFVLGLGIYVYLKLSGKNMSDLV